MANPSGPPSIIRLILIPSVIILAITILGLVAELQHWSPTIFSPTAGPGGTLVGISWFPAIFGAYFAYRLASTGDRPASTRAIILYSLLGFAVLIAASSIGYGLDNRSGAPLLLTSEALGSIIALVLAARPWPALFKTLLAYGYASRIPVVIVMLFAIYGNWGTSYDVPPVPPPDFPEMHWVSKWLLIGALPQLTLWIAGTVLGGMIFGALCLRYLAGSPGKRPADEIVTLGELTPRSQGAPDQDVSTLNVAKQ